nr:arf-GAP with dual PH domain-containing protein 1 isoform X5 [Syngnathus scovelli]
MQAKQDFLKITFCRASVLFKQMHNELFVLQTHLYPEILLLLYSSPLIFISPLLPKLTGLQSPCLFTSCHISFFLFLFSCLLPAEPDWASLTLGVFVCQACSLLHRSIPHISRVKSIRDTWEASEVEIMADLGNNAAQAKYEQNVPAFYYRPTHTDCKMLREQWIRAKYERNEFEFIEKQEPYTAGYREGFLWKRGRDNGQFLSRKFILSEREGALKYFNKQDARDPKAIMKIETLNATFQPAKIGNPCGLQITYLKDNSTRNIFVYHSDAKEMVDWFNAIRAARFHYLQVAFPGASNEEFCCFLAGAKIDPKLHEGRLYGENRSKAHRRLQEEVVHYGRQATDVF